MLDVYNDPHIVYQDGSNLSLKYAAMDIYGDWDFSTLLDGHDYEGGFGFWLGCALRVSGPVVSHYYPLDSELLIYPAMSVE